LDNFISIYSYFRWS